MKKLAKKVIDAIEYSVQNPTTSMTEVGHIFNVGRHTIARYKKDNIYLIYNISNATNPDDENMYHFEEEELEYIKKYLDNPNAPYRSLNIPVERRTLYHWLEIFNKQKTVGGSQKYSYNRDKFSTIETEEDAYWLGFITADGCIIENCWLQLQLAERDRGHLIKFCRYMELPENEIDEMIKSGFGGAYTRDNPVSNVKICSLKIIKNLEEKGISPRKSGKEKPYRCENIELEKAYIRGLIDGDGYIRKTQFGFGLVGSYEICEYVKNFIVNNITDISKNNIREHGIIWKLEINGRVQTSKILEYLYKDSNIHLDRKYNIYINDYNS